MVFNSLTFWIFFAIVLLLYRLSASSLRKQNSLLLLASYFFYGCWNWKFLSLIIFSSSLDFCIGRKIYASTDNKRRKLLLGLSLAGNLGILSFFKYSGFFVDSFIELMNLLHLPVDYHFFRIVLPVGISFYTFQTLSYTIDIYRRQIKPADDWINFFLFVAYFPQLVAGPIERASSLLPQLLKPRKITMENVNNSIYLIIWGLFKKSVIADNLATVVDYYYNAGNAYDGINYLMATYAFAFQIFCDFSGYSDIARGVSRIMGIELMINFRMPYFASNPKDFWSRWHISLSTWLKDYLYISLGGNRKGTLKTYRNLMLTMLLGGLWHGANWTFIAWGGVHGLVLVAHKLIESTRIGGILERIPRLIKIIIFFHVVCITWILFRAENIEHALLIFTTILTDTHWHSIDYSALQQLFFYGLPLLLIQIVAEYKKDTEYVTKSNILFQSGVYFVLINIILIFGRLGGKQFIYFQF